MVAPNFNLWSISSKESLESQQKHVLRKMFLRTLLCSNDILNPGYNRKMLMRKRTSNLDGVCFNYEKLFHPVQCIACRKSKYTSRDKFFLPEVTGILSNSDQLHYLWSINCFGNGTWQYSTCLYQSGSSHILFSYHYILSKLGKVFILWNKFSMSGNCCISNTVSENSFGQVFEVVSTTWQSPNFDFNSRKRFLISPMFQRILNRMEKNWWRVNRWN